jgi:hypothetical protein
MPLSDGTRSDTGAATIAIVPVALLLPPLVVPPLPSFAAPVVNVSAEMPVTVGVPVTVQVMTSPAAIVAGVGGEQTLMSPVGKPTMAQLALVAAAVAVFALVQV